MSEEDYCRWASSCERKVRFSSASHARLRIRHILHSGDGLAVERLVPYRCEFCAGFHIGHAAGFNWRGNRERMRQV